MLNVQEKQQIEVCFECQSNDGDEGCGQQEVEFFGLNLFDEGCWVDCFGLGIEEQNDVEKGVVQYVECMVKVL